MKVKEIVERLEKELLKKDLRIKDLKLFEFCDKALLIIYSPDLVPEYPASITGTPIDEGSEYRELNNEYVKYLVDEAVKHIMSQIDSEDFNE